MDDTGMRTMYVGLFGGMILYALAIAARAFLAPPWSDILWMTLTLVSMIVLIGWFMAVRRGFRIHRFGRLKGKRTVGRKVREGKVGKRVGPKL